MTNKNVDVADRFTSAVYAGDTETIKSLLDSDFVLRQDAALPYGGSYKGAEGFLAFLSAFGEAFDLESLERTQTFATSEDPDVVVFQFAIRGKLRASGQRFDTTVLEHWSFRNGKLLGIVPHWFEVPGSTSS